MDRHHHKILLLLLIVSILLVIAPQSVFAGELDTLQVTVNHDAKSIESEGETPLDTLQKTVLQNTPKKKPVRDWATWHPNPKRALWLALVLPGAGQIYNRKYWKLPLVYGGFVGCVYAMRWNDQMYHDYSQAYLDISDDDPNTQSYNQFLHLGKAITKENMATYQNLFKQRKDRYRRWRDLSFFCLLGVYALSVIDAYVDASLSEFDISNNLSLRVEPAIINNRISRNPFTASAVGLQCSLNF